LRRPPSKKTATKPLPAGAELTIDKITADKITADKITADKITADKITADEIIVGKGRQPAKWAIRDSNPRHPRCKRGALTN
jgi:hypothetical protein